MGDLLGSNGSEQAGIDDLQFRRAEYSSEPPQLACTDCASPLAEEFFELGGVPLCRECAGRWESNQRAPRGRTVLRGAVYSFGAALAGALGLAIIAGMTGYQFSIAAIGVGWLVGKAMQAATGGMGSRRCQVIAVACAYVGISLSYTPELVKALDKAESKQESKKAALPAEMPEVKVGALDFALALAMLFLVILAIPFIGLADGFNGVMGILILFFGVAQAWRMTGRDARVLTGPFSTRHDPPPADGAAAA
jgi:hypothetical protein